jgi:hypothetical protein
MKELGLSRAQVMMRKDCPTKCRKTLDEACRIYAINIPAKARCSGYAPKLSDAEVIALFEDKGASGVIDAFTGYGLTVEAARYRMHRLTRLGKIDFDGYAKKNGDYAQHEQDLIPPSILAGAEARKIVFMRWSNA